MKTCI